MPKIGWRHSEETRRRMSEARKGPGNSFYGKRHSCKSKQKMTLARTGEGNPFYGKKHTDEWRLQMSKKIRGRKVSIESRRKMSEAAKGKVISLETRDKMSRTLRGRTFSAETRRKISEALRGPKHPGWRGGVSLDSYGEAWTKGLKRDIRKRDGYQCLLCGKEPGSRALLDVHHIDWDKHNCSQDNLVTLCRSCHGMMHRKKTRGFWEGVWRMYLSASGCVGAVA